MVKIDTAPVRFYAQLDEKAFFAWAMEIPCVASIDGGFFHIKSKRLSRSDLSDLAAIMYRYKIPMSQLRQFCNPGNEHWFKSKQAYWYDGVFGDV